MYQFTQKQFDEALQVLQNGGVLVFPTETSYGIGCDATNPEAVAKVFEIKGRPEGKGTPVLIPSVDSTGEFVELSKTAQDLARRFWPGGLNIVAPIATGSTIAEQCAQDGTQSIRVSSHPFAATLVRRFGKPIVATSANVSGEPALYEAKAVKESFAGRDMKPDLIIDAGRLPENVPSTTVKVTGERVEVLRQGLIEV